MSPAQGTVGGGAGATVEIGNLKHVVLETGLVYQQLGYDEANIFDFLGCLGMCTTSTLNLGYLGVPVVGKFYLSGQDGSSFFAKTGLIPAVLVDKQMSTYNPWTNTTVTTSNPPIKPFDLSFTIGLGGKLQMTKRASLLLELDHQRSLFNIYNNGDTGYNSANLISIGLGFEI